MLCVLIQVTNINNIHCLLEAILKHKYVLYLLFQIFNTINLII